MKSPSTNMNSEKSVNVEDHDAVLSSAKMHLQILLAQLGYLKATDTAINDPELQRLLPLLSENSSKNVPQGQSVQAPKKSNTPKIEVLHTPQTFIANREYVGKNHDFLLAEPGDRVVVHAWVDGKDAVGFNERNFSAGRISSNFLGDKVPNSKDKFESFIADEPNCPIRWSGGRLDIKSGDRIRICMWNSKKNGVGVNLATGKIGDFTLV
ncbi:uncharacterized protein TRUGW13939_00338 [Talaromyces rugulosus]|uniref:Uncharacterized protein n=1 Tax=Talaromyces rugulosus TaxID=121627 RepID=A0A7H8QI44_TALRU|nr:uncharacterized protein TRUGW13939_00338 [Talaromyces rugulosus]QKX53262.1 hypothetical protein TRUGW13939_00338 [Talaromyces rugulosus]